MCSALPPGVIAARAHLAATEAAIATNRQIYMRARDGATLRFDRAIKRLHHKGENRRARIAWGFNGGAAR